MIKSVSVGFGSKLHIMNGGSMKTVNLTFVSDPTSNNPIGPYQAAGGAGGNNWIELLHGGTNSIMPGAYSNHKPAAWYFGDLYFTSYKVSEDADIYILRWDGSGIYKNGGFTGTNGYAANWRNGRGTQLLSPSGAHNISCNSLGHIVHNGILFMLGPVCNLTIAGGDSFQSRDWDILTDRTNGADISDRRRRRRYISFGIDKRDKIGGKDHKFIGPATEFLPIAAKQDDTHCCDIISYGDDLIFASYCDLVEFPGGSGTPRLIESTTDVPSSKCLVLYPSGGFVGGDPQFSPGTEQPDVLLLTGSGVIKKINFPSGVASGTTTMIDLTDFIGSNVRTSDSLARVTSSTEEPQRSCYIQHFNNQLHAFFSSSTSGYHYMRCDGDTRDSENWTVLTNSLPDDLRRWDGDLYGFHDPFRNALYVMHCAKSEYGVWGEIGGQKGAGGIAIYELNTDFNWRNIYRGACSEPPVGLIPYNNLGVYATVASGSNPQVISSTDYALLTYKLHSIYPSLLNVDIEYSIDNGLTWQDARRFRSYEGQFLGDGKENLQADFFGVEHTFYWAHINQLDINNVKQAILRIIPKVVR